MIWDGDKEEQNTAPLPPISGYFWIIQTSMMMLYKQTISRSFRDQE